MERVPVQLQFNETEIARGLRKSAKATRSLAWRLSRPADLSCPIGEPGPHLWQGDDS